MNVSQNRRIVCWLERAALLLSVFYLCMHTMPRAWGKLITDFPNYYLSARLAHEGYDTSRMYEWTWLQREKDHRAIGVQTIGLVPITPFSTLVMWPLTGMPPLTAKHIWILLNLALLAPIGWMLRSMTGLSYQRIALIFALSFPLHRNLLFGQFYVFLLLLLVAACGSYLRGFHALAGALVAIAAACKIFPVLLFAFFLQRRDWRALISGVATGIAAVAVSVAVFGWSVHRTYLLEILPWTLHGEGFPPYTTSNASISSALHYLFLSEPQWNPHPWHNSPLCYALLQPLLQMLVLAPAILLIGKDERTQEKILMEWSAMLTAALAISTIPASYNFVLMVFPVCVLTTRLIESRRYGWLIALGIAYLGIGFPMPMPGKVTSPAILFYEPRLPLMLAVLLGIYVLLWWDRSTEKPLWNWTHLTWIAVMGVSVVISARSTFHLERAMRLEYAYRLPLRLPTLLTANPESTGDGVAYVAFTFSGYHLATADGNAEWIDSSSDDDLSFYVGDNHIFVEHGLSPRSQIVDTRNFSRVALNNARDPMLSANGQSLAFVRDERGRGQLMMRNSFQAAVGIDTVLTPKSLNVYEASFLSEKTYVFSAVEEGHSPQLYLTDQTHTNSPLELGESRYPALSPDKRWMAYSHFEHGVWNLWVRDQVTGATRRIANAPCNQIQPAWEGDSKTLLYATDCGRSLWFTALAQRRVVP